MTGRSERRPTRVSRSEHSSEACLVAGLSALPIQHATQSADIAWIFSIPSSIQHAFDERQPFLFQSRSIEGAAGAAIPVVCIPFHALFAMQISVHGHAFGRLKRVNQVVGAAPIACTVPPQSFKGNRESCGRVFLVERRAKLIGIHGSFVAPGQSGSQWTGSSSGVIWVTCMKNPRWYK
jgi:hypothetical protein